MGGLSHLPAPASAPAPSRPRRRIAAAARAAGRPDEDAARCDRADRVDKVHDINVVCGRSLVMETLVWPQTTSSEPLK